MDLAVGGCRLQRRRREGEKASSQVELPRAEALFRFM